MRRSHAAWLAGIALLTGCHGNHALLNQPATASASTSPAAPPAQALPCAPGQPVDFSGSVSPADAKSYLALPFAVAPGTTRIELSYGWSDKPGLPATPLTATTLDIGLHGAGGDLNDAAFRGWSGSRQGRIDQGQPPIYLQADSAERGYLPGPIQPGVWTVDLGVGAVVPQGANWQVHVACKHPATGPVAAPDPVDSTHIANPNPGWYYGDFHMHGYNSYPTAPDAAGIVAQARAAGLNFLMWVEYVTSAHWNVLGATQRANPDLIIWPGVEVITYYGHVMTHGETPHLHEYRVGYQGITLSSIQQRAKADGALFQINHPRTFPPPLFSNFCRGCYFQLGNAVDWSQVDTMELVNGPMLAKTDDLGIALGLPVAIENPFVQPAINLWQQQLKAGNKITAVSGSDSKGVDAAAERSRKGYGSSATAVYARQLSRPALKAAIQAGHAYIRTRGVQGSPEVYFNASTDNGQQGIYGDRLQVAANMPVHFTTTVIGGSGQLLTYYRNGNLLATTLVLGSPFVDQRDIKRDPANEGPLGSFIRIETADLQSRTSIGNPIFLQAPDS